MIKEEWKSAYGYEGFYLISSLGRIKSVKTGKIRKPYTKNKSGYHLMHLYKNAETKYVLVHRLVAKTFIDNPNNYEQVNHKDENKQNNCVDNLEWCTPKYNMNYGNCQKNKADGQSIKVIQKTIDGKVLHVYKSGKQAGIETGISSQNINRCVNGKVKTAGGFMWERANE